MKNFTSSLLSFFMLTMFTNFVNAQTVIWGGAGDPNGEFDGGLNGWTAIAVGDPDALWVWDADGAANQGAYGTNIGPIASTSVANGAAAFDSDFYDNAGIVGNFGGGVAPSPQLGELLSPIIDLTGQPYVSLQFTQYTRQFQSTYMVAWSNDGGTTWVDTVTINENIAVNTSSTTSSKITVPLIGGGNTSQFRIKFIYEADYYFWVIDDVAIIARPDFDLKLGDFFYSPASYAQPESQIKSDTFGFLVDVNNIGGMAQQDVLLKVQILKGSSIVYSDEINIGTLVADSPDSTYSFDDVFVPDMQTVGTYKLRYSISSANTDFDATNNTVEAEFKVTALQYAKEDGDKNAVGGIRPGAGGDYFIANLYRTSNNWVDEYQATKAIFSCAVNPEDTITGKAVNIYLMAVNDNIAADLSDFDFNTGGDLTGHPDLTLLGFAEHTFQTYTNYNDITKTLANLDNGNDGVPLTPGTNYFLMVQYAGDASSIFQAFNTKIKYFQNSTFVIDNDGWGAFSAENAAVLRMNIDLYNIADEVSLPDNSLNFYPNPANTDLNVDINLDAPTLANITLADLSGRVIQIDEVENAYQQSRQYDVSKLANGTYIVRIATKQGTKTKKFVVQH